MELPGIAVDFDDVLIPFTKHFLRYLHSKEDWSDERPVLPSYEQLNSPDFREMVADGELCQRLFVEFRQTTHWTRLHDIPPTRECAQALVELHHQGFPLYIVSARELVLQPDTSDYIDRFFPRIFRGVYLGNCYGTGTRRRKWEICQQLNCETLLDDSPSNIAEVEQHGIRGILVRGTPWSDRCSRSCSWVQIIETFTFH